MGAREKLNAWLVAANVQPILLTAFDKLLDELQAEWYNKGKSAGYHDRAHVEWEKR